QRDRLSQAVRTGREEKPVTSVDADGPIVAALPPGQSPGVGDAVDRAFARTPVYRRAFDRVYKRDSRRHACAASSIGASMRSIASMSVSPAARILASAPR